MDYETKPISRQDLRKFALFVRKLFDIPENGAFPVLQVLEHLGDVFKNCNYIVLEDKAFSPQTMARCVLNDLGGYTIEIKQTVYDGAYKKNIGAFLGFICHEICHVFLFKIGFTPVYNRKFKGDNFPPFCSVEWQAKALSAEVMIPYNESRGMSVEAICETYHCSKAFAKNRRKLEKQELIINSKR